MAWGYALIVDLVGSRNIPDRRAEHRKLAHALVDVNEHIQAVQPLSFSVGDEMQGLYSNLTDALSATLLLRLVSNIDCRFGIGAGKYEVIDASRAVQIQDGPAWWKAREAIVESKSRQNKRNPSLRTWFWSWGGPEARRDPGAEFINAYLLCRDHLISEMSPRTKRLMYRTLTEQVSQNVLARAEGITQAGVSNNLRASGAADILDGLALMDDYK